MIVLDDLSVSRRPGRAMRLLNGQLERDLRYGPR